jgi:DNA-binding LacI/PurR family transcriptional regulator
MARTLRKGGSEVIALVIPDVENSFFTALAGGVEDRAMATGYSVVLCNTDELVGRRAATSSSPSTSRWRGSCSHLRPANPTSRR